MRLADQVLIITGVSKVFKPYKKRRLLSVVGYVFVQLNNNDQHTVKYN